MATTRTVLVVLILVAGAFAIGVHIGRRDTKSENSLLDDQIQLPASAAEEDSSRATDQPDVAGDAAPAGSEVETIDSPENDSEPSPFASRQGPSNPSFAERFSSEATDPAWAPNMKALVESVIPLAGVAYSTMETECKTTVCRTVLTGTAPNVSGAFQRSLLPLVEQKLIQGGSVGNPPFQPNLSSSVESALTTTVIYVVRRTDDR